MKYDFVSTERRWRRFWELGRTFRTASERGRTKKYVLDMFPYPSGSGLHVGHLIGYVSSDVYVKYKILKGYNVLHPIGFDSFGLPTEQYSIDNRISVFRANSSNIKTYEDQLKSTGISFDWSKTIVTSEPSYYKWSQWIFLGLFNSWYDPRKDKSEPIKTLIRRFKEKGYRGRGLSFKASEWRYFNYREKEKILNKFRLAYKSERYVNWCPVLRTVLSNDEIEDGESKRGGHEVLLKKKSQWVLRIRPYLNRLLNDLEHRDNNWPEETRLNQKKWINKKKTIISPLRFYGSGVKRLRLKTPSCGSLPFVNLIILNKDIRDKDNYLIYSGRYVINFLNHKKIPIAVSDLFFRGDRRGNAVNYNKPVNRFYVINKKLSLFIAPGGDAKEIIRVRILKRRLNDGGHAMGVTRDYGLRDVIFSRQRYWGEPIPVYYKHNVPVAMGTGDLPLLLPKIRNSGAYKLDRHRRWAWDVRKRKIVNNNLINHKNVFPVETDTMPSWMGSSWYYLRYVGPRWDRIVDPVSQKYWGGVDSYYGGEEHVNGHVLYSRFIYKFLSDHKYVSGDEPFVKITHPGLLLSDTCYLLKLKKRNVFLSCDLGHVYHSNDTEHVNVRDTYVRGGILLLDAFKMGLGSDYGFVLNAFNTIKCLVKAEKMSKSKHNTCNPTFIIRKYGADVLRLHEISLGPIGHNKKWDPINVKGSVSFVSDIWDLYDVVRTRGFGPVEPVAVPGPVREVVRGIEKNISSFKFNAALGLLRKLLNVLKRGLPGGPFNDYNVLKDFVIIASLFAPHVCEEIWRVVFSGVKSIFSELFPLVRGELPEHIVFADNKFMLKITPKGPVKYRNVMRLVYGIIRSNYVVKDFVVKSPVINVLTRHGIR